MSMRYPGGLIATSPVNARYPSGVWTQAQAAPYQAQNVWTRDQFWPNTTLLLQGDGAVNGAQNNTFLDSSSNNFTITRNGNTTQGSFTPYEQDGYWSNYFSGSQSVSAAASSAFQAAGNFTMECWVFRTGTGDQSAFVQQSGSNYFALNIDAGTGFNIYLNSSSPTIVATDIVPATNTWIHVALVRNGSTVRIYLNGVASATTATNSSTLGYNAIAYIGALGTQSAGSTVGYISNFRYVVGTAVYTSNFTPPAAPLTAITNTSLLTCQSNRFKDNSTNAFAITVNGSPSVQAFQPFPGATTWSASVLGGSGYFDGSGDNLTLPSNAAFQFGTGDFCLEAWIYPTDATTYRCIWGQRGGSSGDNSWVLAYNPTNNGSWGYIYLHTDATALFGSSTIVPLNSWTQVVFTCVSGRYRIFQNGVLTATTTASYNFNETTGPRLGAEVRTAGGASSPFIGYIGNARITKGGIPSAYSTSSTTVGASIFTPQTTPSSSSDALTAGSLSVLLNMTNAGIYDNSMMNNLETVGNAQVSTSVVKYGTGSMAFDGSGDYLTLLSTQLLTWGTGDFTIEMWVNTSTTSVSGGASRTMWGTSSASYQGQMYLEIGTGKVVFGNTGSTFIKGSKNVADGAWHHIAVCRNGTTCRLFVDGVQDASGTNSVNYDAQVTYVGAFGPSDGYFNGYIDDLRITKGAARYLTSFTPPPARLPAQ